jgi:hypothetical protein
MEKTAENIKTCKKCERQIAQEARLCSCGFPTEFATFKERAAFEVQQWRQYKETVAVAN